MVTIISERLKLRRFKFSDLNDFYDYAKNPNVGPNAGWECHKSKNESIIHIDNFIKNKEVWAIELKENSKVIGSIGIHKDVKRENPKSRMIGYALNEEYWGKGYATEALKLIIEYSFNVLNLDIVSAYHYSFNLRSKRVIEKCGFKFEGKLRASSITTNGDIYEDMCYSMLKSEYMEMGLFYNNSK